MLIRATQVYSLFHPPPTDFSSLLSYPRPQSARPTLSDTQSEKRLFSAYEHIRALKRLRNNWRRSQERTIYVGNHELIRCLLSYCLFTAFECSSCTHRCLIDIGKSLKNLSMLSPRGPELQSSSQKASIIVLSRAT